jgi:hypothetical protein
MSSPSLPYLDKLNVCLYCVRGVSDYGRIVNAGGKYSDIDPVLTGQLMAVDELAIDFEEYFSCLAAGATHDEAIDAGQWDGVDLSAYAECRSVGAAHAELLEYARGGALLRPYGDCRRVGATHREVMEVVALEGGIYAYCAGRSSGITHDEAVEAMQAGMNMLHYVNMRDWESHQVALEVFGWRVPINNYLDVRRDGISHEELSRAVEWGVWSDYLIVRGVGKSHGDVAVVMEECSDQGERVRALSLYRAGLTSEDAVRGL